MHQSHGHSIHSLNGCKACNDVCASMAGPGAWLPSTYIILLHGVEAGAAVCGDDLTPVSYPMGPCLGLGADLGAHRLLCYSEQEQQHASASVCMLTGCCCS
jgi:hypothetical protein